EAARLTSRPGRRMCTHPLDDLPKLYGSTSGRIPPSVTAVTAFSPGTSATAPRGGKTAARPPLAGEAAPYAAYGRPFTGRSPRGGPTGPDPVELDPRRRADRI